MAGAIVGTEAVLGQGVIVNCGAVVDHHAQVHDFGHLGVNACMAGGSVLGALAWMQAGSAIGYGMQLAAGTVLKPGKRFRAWQCVPCLQASCSAIYIKKAFDGTGWRPARLFNAARQSIFKIFPKGWLKMEKRISDRLAHKLFIIFLSILGILAFGCLMFSIYNSEYNSIIFSLIFIWVSVLGLSLITKYDLYARGIVIIMVAAFVIGVGEVYIDDEWNGVGKLLHEIMKDLIPIISSVIGGSFLAHDFISAERDKQIYKVDL